MITDTIDIRDAFFDQIYDLAKKDEDLIFITDDMDAWGLQKFKKDLPKQFINIGVAEQNMIDVASGLASCGKKVFTYGIASYVTMRCFEQIKFSVCSMRLPVTIVGIGSGFSFEFDGPTHHGTQDIAIMRVLPEINIFNPSDSLSAKFSAKISYQNQKPNYIRLDKGLFPAVYKSSDKLSQGLKVIKPLKKINLISTGYMTKQALKVAETLAEKSIIVGVVDIFCLKPLNKKLLENVLLKSEQIVTLEENSIIGGLGSMIADLIAELNSRTKLIKIAAKDKQFLEYGTREWFHKRLRLDVESIVKAIIFKNAK